MQSLREHTDRAMEMLGLERSPQDSGIDAGVLSREPQWNEMPPLPPEGGSASSAGSVKSPDPDDLPDGAYDLRDPAIFEDRP